MARVKVYFTVDVEVWPGAWTDIDARFPEAYRRYVYGDTAHGQYGLPMKLKVLNDHGLKGVFFVEPVFSARFGLGPLQEIVGLIRDAGQEVQLHVHAEWANEARTPVLSHALEHKVQHLSLLSLQDQTELVGWSKRRLREAGAPSVTAFRAGSFAFNRNTLEALEANDVFVDSSYNHYFGGPSSGVRANGDAIPILPFKVGNVLEYPVTVYRDLPSHVRPLQLKGCSLAEMTDVLLKASQRGHSAVVIVSHNFELLDRRDFSRDWIVAQRFIGLCEFLSRHTDRFETAGFAAALCEPYLHQPAPLPGSLPALAIRYFEQVRRRM